MTLCKLLLQTLSVVFLMGCVDHRVDLPAAAYHWAGGDHQFVIGLNDVFNNDRDHSLIVQAFTAMNPTPLFQLRKNGPDSSFEPIEEWKTGRGFEVLAVTSIGGREGEKYLLVKANDSKNSWDGWISSRTKIQPLLDLDGIADISTDALSPSGGWVIFGESGVQIAHFQRRDGLDRWSVTYKGDPTGSGRGDGSKKEASFFPLGWNREGTRAWIEVNFGEAAETFGSIVLAERRLIEVPAPANFDNYAFAFDAQSGDCLFTSLVENTDAKTAVGDQTAKYAVFRTNFGGTRVVPVAFSQDVSFEVFQDRNGKLGFRKKHDTPK